MPDETAARHTSRLTTFSNTPTASVNNLPPSTAVSPSCPLGPSTQERPVRYAACSECKRVRKSNQECARPFYRHGETNE